MSKLIVMFKPGALSSKQCEKLTKAGYLPLEVADFEGLRFSDGAVDDMFRKDISEFALKLIRDVKWDYLRQRIGEHVIARIAKS